MNNLLKVRDNLYVFILTIIVVLAFILRIYHIASPLADWHSWRQADTASVSKNYLKDGINLFYPRYHDISTIQTGLFNPQGYRFVEFPLYNAIHAFLYAQVGYFDIEVWGRVVSIISSIIGIVVFYYLSAKFVSKKTSIYATTFYSILPFGVYYSRVILPEPMAIMFGLLFLFSYVKFIEKDNSLYLLLSAIFLSLSILVKPFTLFYAIPAVYLTYKKFGIKNSLKQIKLYAFCLVVLVPFILWRVWVSNFPEGTPFFRWVFNGDGIRFKPSYWYWIYAERLGKLILGVWGIFFVIFSFAKIRSKQIFIFIFLFAALFYLALVAEANVRHDYYQAVTLPAISMVLGMGIEKFLDNDQFTKLVKYPIVIVLVFLMLVSTAVQIEKYYVINNPIIIKAGLTVDELVEKDALVIAPYNGDTAFLYQTNRWGWPYKDREIDELIDKGADYFVSVNFDEVTMRLIERFDVVYRTDRFVILDLGKQNN